MSVLKGFIFDPDSKGRLSTGKKECLRRMRLANTNTFVVAPGRCELWNCSSKSKLNAAARGAVDANGTATSVFSTLCIYQEPMGGLEGKIPRSFISVKLWEWSYTDIAQECTAYLGPNGIDAVQVSPVVEHQTGPGWYTKYQPVSLGLNSRSGTREELAHMVATCLDAGVQVIVDVVLNHMAAPCPAATQLEVHDGQIPRGAPMPCVGWNGTTYGDRRFSGSRGWDALNPFNFHHLEQWPMWNCGNGGGLNDCTLPSPGPPGDCTYCDLFGLPDLDTAQEYIRNMQRRHLTELWELGITMIRVDGAHHVHPKDLTEVLNLFPWDLVFQEWWYEPAQEDRQYVGLYQDIFLRKHTVKYLAKLPPDQLPRVLSYNSSLVPGKPELMLFPFVLHDELSVAPNPRIPVYKNGMAMHQAQKLFLAWPHGFGIQLFGGYTFNNTAQGPPGCEDGDDFCFALPVYHAAEAPKCLPTPSATPFQEPSGPRRWVCEHRWTGVAGLVNFRKACRGWPVTKTWSSDPQSRDNEQVPVGRLAWRTSSSCFAALVYNGTAVSKKKPAYVPATWQLQGLRTGLPAGTYCDLAAVPTLQDWNKTSCPRVVVLGADGEVLAGTVRPGDLLAIHAGAMLL